MNKIEGLELCMWKHMSKDEDSTTFNAVTEEDKHHPLYKCKYKCQGNNAIESCYKPLKNYPESEYYKAVMDDYVLVKKLIDRPTRKW